MDPEPEALAAADASDVFCRAVEARSKEHREAMNVAMRHGWWAIVGSLLRMQLDSMVRVIYLLHRPAERDRILTSCVAGEGFKHDRHRIPDRDMIAVADNAWVRAVYEFGNKFVHLTDAHDYAELDPFPAYEHKGEVIKYLSQFHRGKVPGQLSEDGSTLRDIAAYATHVLDKVTSNLCAYVGDLRAAVGQNR
jgi:hypothetical protein